jgi:hypothetical protein
MVLNKKMHEVVGMVEKVIVGSARDHQFGEKGLQDWLAKNRGIHLGYSPTSFVLAWAGWLSFSGMWRMQKES